MEFGTQLELLDCLEMSAGAIFRVKRKRTESPHAALVLAFKRGRPENYDPNCPLPLSECSLEGGSEGGEDTKKEIFRLCGTSETSTPDTSLRTILSACRNSQTSSGTKPPSAPIHFAQLREMKKWTGGGTDEDLKGERMDSWVEEVGVVEGEKGGSGQKSDPTLSELNGIFEAVTSSPNHPDPLLPNSVGGPKPGISCNGQEMIRLVTAFNEPGGSVPTCKENSISTEGSIEPTAAVTSEFVYDYYYSPEMSEEEFRRMENWLGVEPWRGGEVLCGEEERDSEPAEDEDDSNDEGNWRNEYPEEEEEDYVKGEESDTSESTEESGDLRGWYDSYDCLDEFGKEEGRMLTDLVGGMGLRESGDGECGDD